ncbi:ferrous iron transport protein A [Helicobacter sp. faydin-H20]|uniref:FeoA family protein n=1 Tax=Helicobacter anatolicus TaxID=2905874 RepID=UPI001E459C20|nr:FeoA family protein [Helicobacter anatolicus]MCE3036477.1 ferrous iron transport protein A [Helicobacter anatolicus]
MTLMQGDKETDYRIVKIISSDENLLRRLSSFGITKGSIVRLLHCSLNKTNLAIIVGNSQVALRDCEAKQIYIEKV